MHNMVAIGLSRLHTKAEKGLNLVNPNNSAKYFII